MRAYARLKCVNLDVSRSAVHFSCFLFVAKKAGGFGGSPSQGGGGFMAGGAVDSPATGGGSGGQKNKSKQSILAVNVKQVRSKICAARRSDVPPRCVRFCC